METFLKSVELTQDYDCLNMEDDIILCDNFLDEVNKVVKKYPKKMISFFTLKDRPLGENIESGNKFCMFQCVYIPKWLNNKIKDFYKIWINTKKGIENPTGCDYMVADLLGKLKEDYILYIPCLVQHMEMKSRISPRRSTKRQTKYFKGEMKNGSCK